MESNVLRFHPGACYSNGGFGRHWAVRQIIAVQACEDMPGPCVRFKVLVGSDRRRAFTCAETEFRKWARHEVERHENSWVIKSALTE